VDLTNALRTRGVSLELVKDRRDEDEPLIRLADLWAWGNVPLARSCEKIDCPEINEIGAKNGFARCPGTRSGDSLMVLYPPTRRRESRCRFFHTF
jgi:hypothetical protein